MKAWIATNVAKELSRGAHDHRLALNTLPLSMRVAASLEVLQRRSLRRNGPHVSDLVVHRRGLADRAHVSGRRLASDGECYVQQSGDGADCEVQDLAEEAVL